MTNKFKLFADGHVEDPLTPEEQAEIDAIDARDLAEKARMAADTVNYRSYVDYYGVLTYERRPAEGEPSCHIAYDNEYGSNEMSLLFSRENAVRFAGQLLNSGDWGKVSRIVITDYRLA